MRSPVLLVTAIVVSAVLTTSSFAQTPRFERYSNTDYTLDLLDAGDYFYARTEGGLVEYDKITRKSTVYSNLVGLNDNETWSMALDDQQRLWIGTAEGLVRFDGEVREKHPIVLPDGRIAHNIAALKPDGNGGFWVTAHQWSATISISHFDGADWTHFDSSKGLIDGWFGDLVVLDPKEIWFTGRTHKPYGHTGVGHIVNGTLKMYTSDDGLPTSEGRSIARDSSNRIWVGSSYSQNSRLSVFENGSWRQIPPSTLPAPWAVYSMVAAPDGSVWVAGTDAIARFSSNQWTRYSAKEIAGTILSLAIGRSGNVWVGTDSGAAVFENNAWKHLIVHAPLSSNYIISLATDSQGEILIGSNLAIDRPTAESWVHYQTPNEPKRTTLDVCTDRFGNAWARTNAIDSFRGISRWDGQLWEHFELQAMGVLNDSIHDMTKHVDGSMWFSATGGLVHFDGTNWKAFTIDDSLRTWRQFEQIAADSLGNIWTYSNSLVPYKTQGNVTYANQYTELHKFDGTNWTSFRAGQTIGLPLSIGGLEVDKKGVVWFYSNVHGDPERGVGSFDGSATTMFQIPDATGKLRPANLPYDMAIDQDDNIWFAIPMMIENSRFFDGQLTRFDGQNWKHYTDAHGFPSTDEFIQPRALAFLPNGDLWIGTSNVGMIRMRNEQFDAFSVNDGMISNNILSASTGTDGTVWTVSYSLDMFQGITALNTMVSQVDRSMIAMGSAVASPNPFVDRTRVTLSFEKSGQLEVILVDQLGRIVRNLHGEDYIRNSAIEIPIDREGLSSGVYYVRAILSNGDRLIVPVVLK